MINYGKSAILLIDSLNVQNVIRCGDNIKITEQELLNRKRRIIHEAFNLFCQQGIDKVSVKQIAEKANVAEKSVYRYFGSKVALLVQTGSMLWREIITELISAIEPDYGQMTGYQQIETLLDSFRNLYENHAQYVLFSYDYKLYLIRHSKMLTVDEYGEEILPIRNLYLNALQKGLDDHSISAQASVEDLYFAIWGLMRGYIVKIVIYDRMYEGSNFWREEFKIACALILSGLKHGFLLNKMPIPLI